MEQERGATTVPPSPADARRLAGLLAGWYRAEGRRNLPWRNDRTTYGTWVSEVMLQQTRVPVVLERYGTWLAQFPDVLTLAAAQEVDVLAAWAGLGYYRRARLLHSGARYIAALGAWPDGASAWREVPGVGDYTAGAIAAQTLGEANPVVDGNVERVLARVLGVDRPARTGGGRRRIRAASAALLAAGEPGEILQALMDLGALVCRPRSPTCELCPLHHTCDARATGRQHALPVLPARPESRDVYRAHLVARHARSVLLRPARAGEYAEGLWVFPLSPFLDEEPSIADAERLANAEGLVLLDRPSIAPRGRVRASITHHRVQGIVFEATVASVPRGELRKFTLARLGTLGLSAPDRKIVEMLSASSSSRREC